MKSLEYKHTQSAFCTIHNRTINSEFRGSTTGSQTLSKQLTLLFPDM